MQDVNVVIVFYSRTGLTEKLALAAAVGAVQAKANIRLRRLPETAGEETIARDPAWKENHQRMSWEYIAPREADAAWAEGLVVAIPEWMSLASPEVKAYLDSLTGGKMAAAIGPADLDLALSKAGLTVVPPASGGDAIGRATSQGVRLAEAARAARRK
jgi:NAD(P)H dehydrogenase (quinone)